MMEVGANSLAYVFSEATPMSAGGGSAQVFTIAAIAVVSIAFRNGKDGLALDGEGWNTGAAIPLFPGPALLAIVSKGGA